MVVVLLGGCGFPFCVHYVRMCVCVCVCAQTIIVR